MILLLLLLLLPTSQTRFQVQDSKGSHESVGSTKTETITLVSAGNRVGFLLL